VVRPGLIDVTPQEGVKESWPSSTLMEHDGFRVLVDLAHPGEAPGPLLSALEKRGLAPGDIDAVLFTHLHPDHIGHRDLFRSALFAFHESERLAFYFKDHQTLKLSGSALLELRPGTFARPRYTTDWPRLEVGDRRIYVRHLPGHTPGSLAVFARPGGQVHALAGDIVLDRESFEKGIPPGSSWRPELIPEQMRLLARRADVIVPGHGPPFPCHPDAFSRGRDREPWRPNAEPTIDSP
jgi:glyoxylase-like metal-dependent hydrolase (beta-lactamase superfamily II)